MNNAITISIAIKHKSNAASTKLKPEKDKCDQWKVTELVYSQVY